MTYALKEIYYTIQREGHHFGRPSVFCRFTGCNLWSGLEEERSKAIFRFCDTDSVGVNGSGAGHFSDAEQVATAIEEAWQSSSESRFVVCTGNEPLLQLDRALIQVLRDKGFTIAIETNGTLSIPEGIDWVCVSPKAGASLAVDRGDELKLVFPQTNCDPTQYGHLDFRHFFLQPMDDPQVEDNIRCALNYCLAHPEWRLSLQTHKLIGVA